MKKLLFLLTTLALLFLSSCNEEAPVEQNSNLDGQALSKKGGNAIAEQIQGMMTFVNDNLLADGKNYRVAMAEYITNGDGDEVGNTVLSKVVGNKQLTADFVPFDARREEWSGPVDGENDNITYAVDQTGDAVPVFGGLTAGETDAAIVRAMNTWNGLNTDLDLSRNSDGGYDLGYIAALFGASASFVVAADIQHCGWRDLDFGGGVLGVTYTLIWVDDITGIPTDIDNNGKNDVAFREIYYDPSWSWADDGVSNIDVESVALHEAGHGLSQAHFGTVRIKNDGTLQASPWAVMNALYAAPRRELEGTDKGGHSSIWGSWPNN